MVNNQVDIVTALKLVLQTTDGEARDVLHQAIIEIEQLRNLSLVGLELALTVTDGESEESTIQALCQAIIGETQ